VCKLYEVLKPGLHQTEGERRIGERVNVSDLAARDLLDEGIIGPADPDVEIDVDEEGSGE
jgi:hypothetical protein